MRPIKRQARYDLESGAIHDSGQSLYTRTADTSIIKVFWQNYNAAICTCTMRIAQCRLKLEIKFSERLF